MSLLRFAQAHDVINAHVDWVGFMAMGAEKGAVEGHFTVTLFSQVVAPKGVLGHPHTCVKECAYILSYLPHLQNPPTVTPEVHGLQRGPAPTPWVHLRGKPGGLVAQGLNCQAGLRGQMEVSPEEGRN